MFHDLKELVAIEIKLKKGGILDTYQASITISSWLNQSEHYIQRGQFCQAKLDDVHVLSEHLVYSKQLLLDFKVRIPVWH